MRAALIAAERGGVASRMVGHVDAVTCVDCSACGRFFASGGRDQRAILWSTAEKCCLRIFGLHTEVSLWTV